MAPVSSPPSGPNRWAKILYGAGAGADAGSTAALLAKGGHEGNPMVNFAGDKAAIPIGIGEEAGAYFLAHKLLKNHPRIMNAVLAAAGVGHGIAAAHNLQNLPSAPVSHETVVYDTGNGGFIPPR